MIDEICVHNIALIEEASIEPAPGLTAITGETGAGKTAILNACRLLSGQRGDKTMVREGAVEASASGRFFIPGGKGPDGKDEAPQEIVASRRMSADGRSRVKINGEIASVTELSQTISPLLDLSSQHDQLALSHASSHRSLLDLFAAEAVEEPRGPTLRLLLKLRMQPPILKRFASSGLPRMPRPKRLASSSIDRARPTQLG